MNFESHISLGPIEVEGQNFTEMFTIRSCCAPGIFRLSPLTIMELLPLMTLNGMKVVSYISLRPIEVEAQSFTEMFTIRSCCAPGTVRSLEPVASFGLIRICSGNLCFSVVNS